MEHTKNCLQQQADFEEFKKKFPHFHAECWGTGNISETYDPSFGVGSLGQGWITDNYWCGCVENGICPQCWHESLPFDAFLEIYVLKCMRCGWQTGMGAPYFECFCWEQDIPDIDAAYAPQIGWHESHEHTKYRQHEFDALGKEPL